MLSLIAQTTDDGLEPGSEVTDSAQNLAERALEALPRVGLGIAAILAAIVIAVLVRWALQRWFGRKHTESFARVMSKIAGWVVIGIGFLIAATIVFPSVKPVDLLAGAGIFSVAVGFAFKDILENMLAGILLLFREPFQSGDQIAVGNTEGTVEGITIRETRLKTFDGQRVIVPNADVYKGAILVKTAFEKRRSNFIVGVAYEADLGATRETILDALGSVDGVRGDPKPEAFVDELAASTVNIDVRYWTDPDQHDVRAVRDQAMEAVKVALDDAEIEMPVDMIALQATSSLAAALRDGEVTPGGSVASESSRNGHREAAAAAETSS